MNLDLAEETALAGDDAVAIHYDQAEEESISELVLLPIIDCNSPVRLA